MRVLFLASLSLLVAAGCARAPSGLAAEIPGSSWTVERIVLPDGDVLRGDGNQISFGDDGSINVNSCNVCNGQYRLRSDRLEVDPLACTRRGCAPDEIELETYLSEPLTVRRDGSYLILDAQVEVGEGPQILLVPAP